MRLLLFLLPVCLYGQVLTSNHTSCGSATPLMTNGVNFDCAFTGANSNPSIIIVNARVVLNTIPTVCVVTDSAGNTYSQIGPNEPDTVHAILFAFWAKNTSTSTVTVHLNCTWDPMLQGSPIQVRDSIQEFTGVDTLDQIGATVLPTTGIGVINATLTGTTIVPVELVWSVGQTNQGGGPITGSDTAIEDAGPNFMLSQYRVTSSPCMCSATVNFTSTGVASMIIASFYKSGSGITNLNVNTTSAQAVVKYMAPTTGRCTTVASTSSSMTPLFPQTDTAKFTGGLSDSQFSYLDSGLNRTIVLGQKAVLRGTVDTVPYSMALASDTTYYIQTTCNAVTTTYTVSTRAAALGLSWVDPIQADPLNPGENFNPWVDFSTRQFYTDAQTGLQFEPITLTHDVTGCGAACSPLAVTNTSVTKIGGGWTGSNFPYTITSDNTSYLVFNANTLRFWGSYPYNNVSVSYSSDNMANLNWAQWALTMSSTGSGDVMTGCMSENGVSCDPWAAVVTCNIPTSSGACTLGTGTTANQGGWMGAGHRFRNGPETTPRTGNALCAGTSVTFDQYVNHLWTNGTPIKINNTTYNISALTGDFTATLQSSCGTTVQYSITGATNATPIVITAPGNTFANGDQVYIQGVGGNGNANGTFQITVVVPGSIFSLNSSSGSGTFTGGGTADNTPYVANSLYWLLKLQASSAHTVTLSSAQGSWEYGLGASWPPGGFWGENSYQPVNGVSSQPGYLVGSGGGMGLYWFNLATGATSLIGAQNLTGGNLCNSNSVAWDTRVNVSVMYCNATGTSGLKTFTYTPTNWAGFSNLDNNNPNQLCGSPPCWTISTLASSVDALTTAFNPAYATIGTNKGITANNIIGINQHNDILIRAWTTDSTPGWLIMFNPTATTNSAPGNAGCNSVATPAAPGCVVAAIPTFAAMGANNQTLRAGPMKGSTQNNIGNGLINMGAYFWANNSANGGGPWQVGTTGGFAFAATVGSGTGQITTCPGNPFGVSGSNCTAVPIDGQPYDPTPGPNETGARGEYITIQPGDYQTVGGDNYTGGFEMVRVMVVNMSVTPCGTVPAPCEWVQRGTVRNNLYCGPGGGVGGSACGSPNLPPQSSAANVLLQYVPGASGVYWNYLADPNGTSLLQEYMFDSTCHQMQFNGIGIDACSAQTAYGNNGCVDTVGQCYGMKLDPSGNTWNLLSRVTPVFDGVAIQNPSFNNIAANINGNCSGGGCGNSTQIHPTTPGGGGTKDSNRYGQDSRPFNGYWISPPCVASNVSGFLWKIAVGCQAGGGILHRKSYPTKATWGWHPLLDVSPTVLGATSSDNLKYCVAVAINDCFASSSPGDIYFNVPWLTYPYSYFPCQSCSSPDIADITIADGSANLDSVIQFPLDDPSDRGARSRILTRAFAPTRVNAPFYEVQALPNNGWWVFRTRSFASSRADVILVKRPVEQQDSINRTMFSQPTTALSAAPGYAMIQWGYLEYGANGTTHWYCTTRADSCNSSTTPTTTPYWFGAQTLTPTVCSSGCTVTPSFLPDRVALWRLVRTDASGNIILTGPAQVIATP